MRATTTAVMFGKATDEWSTPQDTFDALDREFAFTTDAAATADNRKVPHYYGPDRQGYRDALQVPWAFDSRGPVWLNPPYSKCRQFVGKAAREAEQGVTVVCLVPSRTDTRWWHEHVWDASRHACRPGVEVRFVKGRLKFGNSANSAPFPSVVIVFRPPQESA